MTWSYLPEMTPSYSRKLTMSKYLAMTYIWSLA
jgi:hypothetical protein